jgi:hypothetical protein
VEDLTLRWKCAVPALNDPYVDAVLHDQHVFSTRFCLERESGAMVWENDHRAAGGANRVVGVEGGMIVATQANYVEYGTSYSGIFRFDIASGAMLRTQQAPERRYFFGFVRVDDGGYPISIDRAQIVTRNGWRIDLCSGKLGDHTELSNEEQKRLRGPETGLLIGTGELEIPNLGTVRRPAQAERASAGIGSLGNTGSLLLELLSPGGGEPMWRFDPALEQGYRPGGTFNILARPPWLFLFYLTERYSDAAGGIIPVPSRLLILDLRTGKPVVVVNPFEDEPVLIPSLVGADTRGVLFRWWKSRRKDTWLGYSGLHLTAEGDTPGV